MQEVTRNSAPQRLTHRLEVYANAIESVLNLNDSITGGHVEHGHFDFKLREPMSSYDMGSAKDELKRAPLFTDRQVFVWRDKDNVCKIRISHQPPPVLLATLLNRYAAQARPRSVIGMTQQGPLAISLTGVRSRTHTLISGDSGCGKTSLLRTVAVAALAAQSPVGVLVVTSGSEPFHQSLAPLKAMPKSVMPLPIQSDPREATNILCQVQRRGPDILILIDNLDELIDAAPRIRRPLQSLMSRDGITVVATSTSAETSRQVPGFRLHITGKRRGDKLLGEGDFYLETSHVMRGCYFQAGYADVVDTTYLVRHFGAWHE